MFNCEQLTELVIKPSISDLQLYSDDAVELLIFTCANESQGGTFLKQVKGPALGIYQMEPNTYNDIWQNYLNYNQSLLLMINHNFNIHSMPVPEYMIHDLRFATAMARLFYARIKSPLPKADDINAIWDYYKTHYNTSSGKADYHLAVNAYHRFKSNSGFGEVLE